MEQAVVFPTTKDIADLLDRRDNAPRTVGGCFRLQMRQSALQINWLALDPTALETTAAAYHLSSQSGRVRITIDIRCSKGVREPSVPVSAPDGNILLTGVSRSPSKELFGDRP